MKYISCSLLSIVSLSILLPGSAADTYLGSAAQFAVIAASDLTNSGATTIYGNVALTPGTSITGFPEGIIIGTENINNEVALNAMADANSAFTTLFGLSGDTLAGELGGITLVPGVYTFSSSASLTNTLTLNAQGDQNAVWIFQISSSLTVETYSDVVLENGGQVCNVFWALGSSATIGTGSKFIGTIIASASISLSDSVTVNGGLFALNGGVTLLDDDVYSLAECPSITSSTLPTSSTTSSTLPSSSTTSSTQPSSSTTSSTPPTSSATSSTQPSSSTTSSTLPTSSTTSSTLPTSSTTSSTPSSTGSITSSTSFDTSSTTLSTNSFFSSSTTSTPTNSSFLSTISQSSKTTSSMSSSRPLFSKSSKSFSSTTNVSTNSFFSSTFLRSSKSNSSISSSRSLFTESSNFFSRTISPSREFSTSLIKQTSINGTTTIPSVTIILTTNTAHINFSSTVITGTTCSTEVITLTIPCTINGVSTTSYSTITITNLLNTSTSVLPFSETSSIGSTVTQVTVSTILETVTSCLTLSDSKGNSITTTYTTVITLDCSTAAESGSKFFETEHSNEENNITSEPAHILTEIYVTKASASASTESSLLSNKTKEETTTDSCNTITASESGLYTAGIINSAHTENAFGFVTSESSSYSLAVYVAGADFVTVSWCLYGLIALVF